MPKLPLIEDDQDLLDVIRNASSEELGPLVEIITKDKDGDARWAENLTALESYKQHYPDHQKYADEIASEVQTFGAHAFITLFRGGKGVTYKEIVCDVADKFSAKYDKAWGVEAIEDVLLLKILSEAYSKMSPEERKELLAGLGDDVSKGVPTVLPVAALQILIRATGFAGYRISVIIANAIAKAILGRGLPFAGNALITRILGVAAGPVGLVASGIWAASDVMGPAYRVTIPAVIQVAMLRKVQGTILCPKCGYEHSKNAAPKFCMDCGAKLT